MSAVLTRVEAGATRVRYLPFDAQRWRETALGTLADRYAKLRKLPVYQGMPKVLSHIPLERVFDIWVGLPDESLANLFPVWEQNRDEILALFP